MSKALSQSTSGRNQYNPVIVGVIYSLLFKKKKIGSDWTPCGKLEISCMSLTGSFAGAEFKNQLKIPCTIQGK